MGGVSLDGHPAEAEGEIVSMGTHQVDATLGFLFAYDPQRGVHALRLCIHVGEVGAGGALGIGTDDAVDRSIESEAQATRRVGDVVIGARCRLHQ